jgi:hypothetical protein
MPVATSGIVERTSSALDAKHGLGGTCPKEGRMDHSYRKLVRQAKDALAEGKQDKVAELLEWLEKMEPYWAAKAGHNQPRPFDDPPGVYDPSKEEPF